MSKNSKVVLASGSPRRIALLGRLIEDFEVISPKVDESTEEADPSLAVMETARKKASAIPVDGIVIAADTIVYDGVAIGKPKDEADAVAVLMRLAGRKHQVYTGVCIKTPNTEDCFYVKTDVFFKPLTEEDALWYVQKYKPLDKAGAYGIQDGVVVEKIEGSFDNVVGFPTEEIRERLRLLNVPIKR